MCGEMLTKAVRVKNVVLLTLKKLFVVYSFLLVVVVVFLQLQDQHQAAEFQSLKRIGKLCRYSIISNKNVLCLLYLR